MLLHLWPNKGIFGQCMSCKLTLAIGRAWSMFTRTAILIFIAWSILIKDIVAIDGIFNTTRNIKYSKIILFKITYFVKFWTELKTSNTKECTNDKKLANYHYQSLCRAWLVLVMTCQHPPSKKWRIRKFATCDTTVRTIDGNGGGVWSPSLSKEVDLHTLFYNYCELLLVYRFMHGWIKVLIF